MPPALFGLDLLPGVLWWGRGRGNLPSSKLKPVPREIGITAPPQSGSMWANELVGNQPVPAACSKHLHTQPICCVPRLLPSVRQGQTPAREQSGDGDESC